MKLLTGKEFGSKWIDLVYFLLLFSAPTYSSDAPSLQKAQPSAPCTTDSIPAEPPSAGLPQKLSGIDLNSGKQFQMDLSRIKNGTVIIFLSTRCPCSASHLPALEALFKEFGSKGFQFVGVHSNANESLEEARQYFANAKLPFSVLHDPLSKTADQFEAFKTPHSFVMSPQLKILFQGGVDNSKVAKNATRTYLMDALAAIDRGEPVKEKYVRVVGCQIQRP